MKSPFGKLLRSPKLIFILLCALLLVCFNLSRRTEPSEEAKAFTSWLKAVRISFAEGQKNTPLVTMKLELNNGDNHVVWRVETAADNTDSDRKEDILRLLDLVKESDIFSRGSTVRGDIHLLVVHGERQFSIFFNQHDVEADIAISNFIKLFQIYGSTEGR